MSVGYPNPTSSSTYFYFESLTAQ
uniref:Uncharacterized protein n=1 Tax=Arundo donax TaxID=35708 RepID=A0A0A9ARS1_ARUDO